MAKREFLQLAHTYDPKKHGLAGWFLSEKIDGMRALWDGGISRGKLASEVPWANVEKHARFVVKPVATGLWTRYGQVIHAPDWFLDSLPTLMLDGELYARRGNFQRVVSTVKKLEPVFAEWNEIRYMAFDCPQPRVVFSDGEIKNTNFKKVFSGIPILKSPQDPGFASRLKILNRLLPNWSFRVHEQRQLSFKTSEAVAETEAALDAIIAGGGEGVILKSPSNLWLPERSHTMLKLKACNDAEGTVIGYTTGRETDKGSKLLGLMGALILRQGNGQRLELSGFTDAERVLSNPIWAAEHPGQEVPLEIDNPMFPRGSKVTYTYRELTDAGIAKEGRYFRKVID